MNKDIINKEENTVSSKTPITGKYSTIPFYRRLRFKLLLLIALSVFITEILVFIPSIVSMRQRWLEDRHQSAEAISLILAAVPYQLFDKELKNNVLVATDALAIMITSHDKKRELILQDCKPQIDNIIHLGEFSETKAILESFSTLFWGGNKTLLLRETIEGTNIEIDMIIGDARLRDAMLRFTGFFILISLTIAIIAATLIYLIIYELLVRPLQNIYNNMIEFVIEPDNPSRILVPESRRDEVGATQRRIAAIEIELQKNFVRQKHLANLGLAVSKINHDMRNILASAQLMSDHLCNAKEPMVRKMAPKLIKAIDRAVKYSHSVLTYGRTQEIPPKCEIIALEKLVDDIFDSLKMPGSDQIEFLNCVSPHFNIYADYEQLHRALTNLSRNAVQAMIERPQNGYHINRLSIKAYHSKQMAHIIVEDTGPGLPEKAKKHLYSPFEGSVGHNGSGLGLAISKELITAHGGTLNFIDDGQIGTKFEIDLPDK